MTVMSKVDYDDPSKLFYCRDQVFIGPTSSKGTSFRTINDDDQMSLKGFLYWVACHPNAPIYQHGLHMVAYIYHPTSYAINWNIASTF